MKNIIIYSFLWLFPLLCRAGEIEHAISRQAVVAIFDASQVEDYSNYEEFSRILGFQFNILQSHFMAIECSLSNAFCSLPHSLFELLS